MSELITRIYSIKGRMILSNSIKRIINHQLVVEIRPNKRNKDIHLLNDNKFLDCINSRSISLCYNKNNLKHKNSYIHSYSLEHFYSHSSPRSSITSIRRYSTYSPSTVSPSTAAIAAVSALLTGLTVYYFRQSIESTVGSTSPSSLSDPLPPLPPAKVTRASITLGLDGEYESGSDHEISGGAGDPSHSIPSRLLPSSLPTSLTPNTIPLLSYQTIMSILSTHSKSIPLNRGSIGSIEYCQYAANEAIEDSFAIETHLNAAKGTLIGVFDGHSGSAASIFLRRYFFNYLQHYVLNGWADKLLNERVFYAADSHFIEQAWDDKRVLDGLSGACMNVVHIEGRQVTCANAGDCVAVIGRRISNSTQDAGELLTLRHTPGRSSHPTHIAIPLSFEHQIDTDPKEKERLLSAHPMEEDIIRRDRVKGRLQPSRGFGDAAYKSVDYFKAKKNLNPTSATSRVWTPPYTTVHPDIITHQLNDRDEFLVLSSDGLYQDMNVQEVIEYVVEWKEKQQSGQNKIPDSNVKPIIVDSTTKTSSQGSSSLFSRMFGISGGGKSSNSSSSSTVDPMVPASGGAATYLVEKSLTHASYHAVGARNRLTDNLSWILNLPLNSRRSYHDDCTVIVVWFNKEGEGENEQVTEYKVNLPPALARAIEKQKKGIKAKL